MVASTYVALQRSLVHDPVDLVGRNARLNGSRSDVQYFSPKSASLTHTVLLLLGENSYAIPPSEDLSKHQHTRSLLRRISWHKTHLLALRYSCNSIIRLPYLIRDSSARTERVHRSQAAGKRVRRERVEMAICVW